MHDTIEGLHEIRDLAGQFAAERLRPNVERWDHEREIDADVLDELAQLGFHGMLVPESHGGLDFGIPAFTAVLEQMAWGEPVIAFGLLASGIVATAIRQNEGAATRWLEDLATGTIEGAVPLARSHCTLRATGVDEDWILDGTAGWVLRGRRSVMVVEAIAGEDDTIFCVPLDTAGITVQRREDTLGLRSARIESLGIGNVQVGPDSRLTGAPLDRLRLIEHAGTAAIASGIARAAFEHAVAYADQREQFGRRIRMFQGIRMKLADMKIRVDAAGALLDRVTAAGSAGGAAAARVLASECAMWVTTQAVQVFGGYGYMRDYPVEKTMRDAKGTEILTEPNDALRESIAGALYPN